MYKDGMFEGIRNECNKDNNYKKIKSCKEFLRELYTAKENITVKYNLIMCKNRVVSPNNIKKTKCFTEYIGDIKMQGNV